MKQKGTTIIRQRDVIRILSLWLLTVCGLASCSSDDGGKDVTPATADWGAKVRIDSIARLPDNPAVYKFDYNSDQKVTRYSQENGWSYYYGADSVSFDYQANKIIAHLSYLKELSPYGIRTKVNRTATFYLQGNKIARASLPLEMHETLTDSIVYFYEGDKLSKYEVHEVAPATTPYFKYEQRLLWNDLELVGMTATRDSETIYETSFSYDGHAFTALLPYMTFDYLLDNDKTYMSVLANMGYFGMLPRHDLSAITVLDPKHQYKYQCQVSCNYAANGLPESYDYKSGKWFKASTYESWQAPDEEGWLTIQSQYTNGLSVTWCKY